MTTSGNRNVQITGQVELIESLNSIRASDVKPIELMLAAINMPVDEQGCRDAGMLLQRLKLADQAQVPQGADELAGRWSRHPQIGTALTELRASIANMPGGRSGSMPRWQWLIFSVIGLIVGLYAFAAVSDNNQRLIFGAGAAALIVIGIIAFGVEWAWKARNENIRGRRAESQAAERLGSARRDFHEAVRDSLNRELEGGLEGPTAYPTYSSWYIKWPLTAESPPFNAFLDDENLTLSDLVERYHPEDHSTIQRRFKDNVGERVLASNWESTDYPKNVVLVPIGHKMNLDKFEIGERDLPTVRGLERPIIQPATEMGFRLSCLYIILRSPMGEEDIANHDLYERVTMRVHESERNRRDIEPRLGASSADGLVPREGPGSQT